MILEAAYALAVTWILVRAVRQYGRFHRVEGEGELPNNPVTVIIPVRNEELNIGACLDAILAQQYPRESFRVIVVDDDSSDDTREIVRSRASPIVKLLRAPPLPAGWTGKCHACWQGALFATGEYLCFVDADVRAMPRLLARAVGHAKSHEIDFLSLEPFQRMGSFWERMIIPAGFLLLAATQDLGAVNDPHAAAATANGQFILVRRDAYQDAGGHAAVRNAVAEDSALAMAVKRAGNRVAVLDGADLLQVRMYHSLPSLWEGLSKNIPQMLHGIGPSLVAALLGAGLAAASVWLPAQAAWMVRSGPSAEHVIALLLAMGASLALLFTHVGIARHFRFPRRYAILFPLAYLVGAVLVCDSVLRHLRGDVSWKGRTYRPSAAHGSGEMPL